MSAALLARIKRLEDRRATARARRGRFTDVARAARVAHMLDRALRGEHLDPRHRRIVDLMELARGRMHGAELA